jgi:hypothetical protein
LAVDPKADADYRASKDIKFAAGQTVWVSGLEFTVVSITNGQLVLKPVSTRL